MFVRHYTDTEPQDAGQGSKNVTIRWVINKDMGAPNFAMRFFEMAPEGFTPQHTHEWEHEVFIVKGSGIFVDKDEKEHKLTAGSVVFVPSNELHQFKNKSNETMEFICVVPV